MGGKKKYIKMFGSFTEPFISLQNLGQRVYQKMQDTNDGLLERTE